jgi:2-hydroxychromene-2-carboxylate isomerase
LFAEQQGRLLDYSRKVYELFFKRELEADQSEAVASVIADLGMSASDYRKYLSAEGALAYQRAQDEAASDHVFGVPLFIFEGEPFWGHDRIPILENRLAEAGLKLN